MKSKIDEILFVPRKIDDADEQFIAGYNACVEAWKIANLSLVDALYQLIKDEIIGGIYAQLEEVDLDEIMNCKRFDLGSLQDSAKKLREMEIRLAQLKALDKLFGKVN